MKLRFLATAAFAVSMLVSAQDKKPAKEAQDPVCGMMVDTATSPKSEYKGKTYYFCSIDEKKEFDKAPATYIKTVDTSEDKKDKKN